MRTPVVLALLSFTSAVACSGTSVPQGFGQGGSSSGGTSSGGSGSGGNGSGGSGSGGVNLGGNVGNDSGTGASGDGGFVCAPNPLNYDIPANGCDDDGNGKVDDVVVCDAALPKGAAAGTATEMLRAMGLCQPADATHWGFVGLPALTNGHLATSAPGDPNFPFQHGILNAFGSAVKPQEGTAFGVLSSGTADVNDTKDTGPYFKGTKTGMQSGGGDVPTGFPKASGTCIPAKDVHDVIALKAQIKVPANAKGFSFDFDFYSGEWPEYVCSNFNDSFIAYLSSKAFNGGAADNISFDSKGNPVSVNIGFFGVCSPGSQVGCLGNPLAGATAACPAGAGALTGTGFDDPGSWCPLDTAQSSGGGATGWLTSTAPAQAGETISLEFIIWDTGDPQYDSSVLLDHFVWQPQQVAATPVTQPSPPPK